MIPAISTAKTAAPPTISARWRLANFRNKYVALGGRATIGSSFRYRRISSAMPAADA
jgi:hypothetical protein